VEDDAPGFYIADDRTTLVASRKFTNAGIILQEMNFLFELSWRKSLVMRP
jgi:hypothetical protein